MGGEARHSISSARVFFVLCDLRHVVVLVLVVLVALHVVAIDQRLDALLEVGRLRNQRQTV